MRLATRWSGLLLAALLFAPSALGTEQRPDLLLIDGEQALLQSYPLAGWLQRHPVTVPPSKFGGGSADNRGYVATWELSEDKLWLRKLGIAVGQREGEWDGVDETWPYIYEDMKDQLFPGVGTVEADWFSGMLIALKGKRVLAEYMGEQTLYERYSLLWIRQGELTRRMDFDAKQYVAYRKERFAAFKLTGAYRKEMRLKEDHETWPDHEEHLFDWPWVYISEQDPGPAGR